MSISGIYSLNNEVINSTETSISTSSIDIELNEYTNSNGETVLFNETNKTVMPGEKVSLIPRVNNLGEDCYVRAKVTYTINGREYDINDYLDIDNTKWIKNGEYYYLDSILGKSENVDIFNNVNIPNLGNEYMGKQVILNIHVDAIQSKNVTVDNSSDDPWNGIEIKKSIEREYTGTDGSSTVCYSNGADKGITIPDNFFGALGNLMPGDSKEETVQINNRSENKNDYLLSVETDNLSDEEKSLLDKVKLKVTDQDGNVVIEDTLSNINNKSLGVYPSGKTGTLKLEVIVPTDADNSLSKISTKITWKFSLNSEAPPIHPNTGDFRLTIALKTFIFSSIGFLIVLILYKKKQNEEKKEGKI